MPLVSLTRATLRSAEFGFFGVVVYTRVQTPRRWGLSFSAAVLVLETLSSRPLRTSCWIVGMDRLLLPVGGVLRACHVSSTCSCGVLWCYRAARDGGLTVPRGRACRLEIGSR